MCTNLRWYWTYCSSLTPMANLRFFPVPVPEVGSCQRRNKRNPVPCSFHWDINQLHNPPHRYLDWRSPVQNFSAWCCNSTSWDLEIAKQLYTCYVTVASKVSLNCWNSDEANIVFKPVAIRKISSVGTTFDRCTPTSFVTKQARKCIQASLWWDAKCHIASNFTKVAALQWYVISGGNMKGCRPDPSPGSRSVGFGVNSWRTLEVLFGTAPHKIYMRRNVHIHIIYQPCTCNVRRAHKDADQVQCQSAHGLLMCTADQELSTSLAALPTL